MHEYVINLHMHTTFSDGHGTHADIVRAALKAGLDAVIVTDHNVLVQGLAGYYREGDRRTLLMIGEEVHDHKRDPQKNHLLVIGANRELATQAEDPKELIAAVRQAGGLSFIAHPVDPAAPAFDEPDISWVSWEVQDYTGIELWNALSEFKGRLKSKLHAVYYAFNPAQVARGPFPAALECWDSLLRSGKRVVAVGGSDAHALPASLGPLKRTLFPYEFHFLAVNTHIFTERPLSGDETEDRGLILEALRRGHCFIGYDLPASTRGFQFKASGLDEVAWMGDEISAGSGVTLQVRLPARAECRLLKDGKVIKTWRTRETCAHITNEPGVYRVEVYLPYLGRLRTWILSNPIYVRK